MCASCLAKLDATVVASLWSTTTPPTPTKSKIEAWHIVAIAAARAVCIVALSGVAALDCIYVEAPPASPPTTAQRRISLLEYVVACARASDATCGADDDGVRHARAALAVIKAATLGHGLFRGQ